MEGSVHLENNNKIGRIKFFHPKGNSLPSSLLQQVVQALKTAETDSDIGVVVLESRGNTFCAGASPERIKSIKIIRRGNCLLWALPIYSIRSEKMSKFVLASVHEKVVGGGVGLIAACDYAFATHASSVKLSELSIGLGPYVIEPALSQKNWTHRFCTALLGQCPWKVLNGTP